MKPKGKIKDLQGEIVDAMKNWQRMEDASLASTGRIIEKTTNPIIRLTMEIIQRDSQMHYNVEKWVAESLQSAAISLAPEELRKVWAMIERHIELEQKMIDTVKKLLPSLKGKRMVLQEYLLNYLLEDETKHANLLKRLEGIKRGMLPVITGSASRCHGSSALYNASDNAGEVPVGAVLTRRAARYACVAQASASLGLHLECKFGTGAESVRRPEVQTSHYT